ncbi:MAG: hydroxyacid dehydrogenase, partial [Burkholderiales bacterium]
MHKVLIADTIAEEGLTDLRARPGFEVVVATGETPEALASRIADCNAVIVRSTTRITRAILSAAPRLRVVGRAGIGVDNIDVEAATELGIVVLNTPDANATTTAELTVAHLLSLSRHLPEADRSVRAGEWRRTAFLGTEVAGKTLGIIGYGTIGRLVAARALGLKMRVLAHDPYVTREVMEADGVDPLGLDQLLGSADYVTLHCTLSEKTRKLLDASRLRLMRRGARLINCARGGLVDEGALFE